MEEIKITNQNVENENILNELETMMLDELRYYANKELTINAKAQRLAVTDRICKTANVIIAVENLKERQYMNRTERKESIRKTKKIKS